MGAARIVSLDHLTLLELTPPELVRTAAAAGFSHVGLRLKPAAASGEAQHPIVGDTPMRRDTQAALRDTGVRLLDWGVLRLGAATVVADFEPWLASAAELGGADVLVNGDEGDEARLADLAGALGELAARYAMRFHLEPTPWTGLRTLAQAARVLARSGAANGRVMVDTLHVDRSGQSAADIAQLPPGRVSCVQLCDGALPRPADDAELIRQARQARLWPGAGSIDLVAMLRAAPAHCAVSLECPTEDRSRGVPALQRARHGRAALQALLERARSD